MIKIVILATLITGGWLLGSGSWIWAKATLAQHLLEQTWSEMQQSKMIGQNKTVKPWPWADTYATAKLQVPELSVDMVVLQGDSGRTLAFGPGHSSDSAQPGDPGTTVISGHRDTHFAFLEKLTTNMRIQLHTLGDRMSYRVKETRIIDSRKGGIMTPENVHGLLLVTCYPFDSIEPGGPLRYLVWAEAESQIDQRDPASLGRNSLIQL